MHFQFHNIAIGNNHAVPLGRRGPLRVMLCCSFILDFISGCMRRNIFDFARYQALTASVSFKHRSGDEVKSDVQRFSLSSFMA